MQTKKFSAQFKNLDEIRSFVGDIAREGGFSDKEIYSIQLATDEAASNVIEHAYGEDPKGKLEISADVTADRITIILRDNGKAFDSGSVRQPDLQADLSERQVGGLGIYLMRKLMDEVRYETVKKGGNLLTLVKRKG
jgi:anti-sigma regulatory factor (Ser/Thr protein kinase)